MLLTRSPLDPKAPFDLHVLSPPLAFALSQDQTLQFNLCSIFLVFHANPLFRVDLHRTDETIPSLLFVFQRPWCFAAASVWIPSFSAPPF